MTPVDFESFKESGGIEYTADVVWGLQHPLWHSVPLLSSEIVKYLNKHQQLDGSGFSEMK